MPCRQAGNLTSVALPFYLELGSPLFRPWQCSSVAKRCWQWDNVRMMHVRIVWWLLLLVHHFSLPHSLNPASQIWRSDQPTSAKKEKSKSKYFGGRWSVGLFSAFVQDVLVFFDNVWRQEEGKEGLLSFLLYLFNILFCYRVPTIFLF